MNTPTNETPQTLGSGKVAAVGAWYPVSGQALKQVAGSKPLFTSADAKGLIYDVLAVNPISLGKRKADWAKVVAVYYKCVDYLLDPADQGRRGQDHGREGRAPMPTEYSKAIPGTHFLTLAEAKAALKKGDGLDSIYGSMAIGNKFNLDNKVYKVSQKPESYLAPSIVVAGLK